MSIDEKALEAAWQKYEDETGTMIQEGDMFLIIKHCLEAYEAAKAADQPDRMSVLQTATCDEIESLTWDDKEKDKPIIMQLRDNLREWSEIAKDRSASIEYFRSKASELELQYPYDCPENIAPHQLQAFRDCIYFGSGIDQHTQLMLITQVEHYQMARTSPKRESRSGRQPIETAPKGVPVIVAGGLAMQKTGGEWFTGMEEPRYQRPLQWQPAWWMPIPTDNARRG